MFSFAANGKVTRQPRDSTFPLIRFRGASTGDGIRRRAASAGEMVRPEMGVYSSGVPIVAFQMPGNTGTHAGDLFSLAESDSCMGVAAAALAASARADPFSRSLRFIICH